MRRNEKDKKARKWKTEKGYKERNGEFLEKVIRIDGKYWCEANQIGRMVTKWDLTDKKTHGIFFPGYEGCQPISHLLTMDLTPIYR